MRCKTTLILLVSLVPASAALVADEKPKVNYKDQVAGIFQSKCNACHNNDKKKGGLALDSYSGVMQGGGSGAVIEPGDPDNSRLYLLVAHQEEPNMPPNAPAIPDADLATIKAWIEAGAPETSGSAVAVKAKPKLDFKLDPAAMGKPQGEPAMPEGILTEPIVVSVRPNAVVAMATSPWAPLAAIGSHKQVLLYNLQTRRLNGVLPFPEGTIYSLRFSRDGGILLAAGGRGAEKGLAVAFDVKSGQRLFEVGKEYDVALAADISPDRSLVALGGPGKVLRVYNTADGELAYESKKHTDWVTAIEFSPDGVLLASGDRNGGLVVWEANTGREFYDLRNHTAMITDLSWRLDSNVLASSSEDGTVRLWEMQNGGNLKGWNAHGGGVESVRFAKDGRLASAGRDRQVKLWDQNGGGIRSLEAFPDIALETAFSPDDALVLGSDWSGEVRVYQTADGARAGNLVANPAPISSRLEQAIGAHGRAVAAAQEALQRLQGLQADATAKAAAVEAAQSALTSAEALAASAATEQTRAEEEYRRRAELATAEANALWSAKNTDERSRAVRGDAESALGSATAAVENARKLAEATGNERDRQIVEKAEASLVSMTKLLEAATLSERSAGEAVVAAQERATTADKARDEAEQSLPNLRKAAADAQAQLAAARKGMETAATARAAADQAVAKESAPAQALAAQAEAAAAEVEALKSEQTAFEASRSGGDATTTAGVTR